MVQRALPLESLWWWCVLMRGRGAAIVAAASHFYLSDSDICSVTRFCLKSSVFCALEMCKLSSGLPASALACRWQSWP